MLLTLLPLALASAPPGASVRPPCGTPAVLPALGPAPVLPPPPPFPKAEKQARNAYDELPNELRTENFVLRWGNRGGIDQDEAEHLVEAFEHAWTTEVEEQGFPGPAGTDRYLFNVYIGDTGDGAPDGYGTSGYFNRDADGYPMIVVSAATLDDLNWATGTAAHEFFHAIQDVTGRYEYSGDSAWYWEATAMWIEGEVLEDYEEYAAFLYGYALLPHLSIQFFDYPDSGALQEYHQYGAMIFPRYVSEIAADSDVIRDSWVEDSGADTPLESIAELLADRGIAFEDVVGDFAARNATWDYADGEIYARWVDWYADYYRDEDHRVVATHEWEGTDGLVDAPEDTLPGRYAYNVVTFERPEEGDWRVRFEGAPEGDRGSGSDWRVTVVRELPGGPSYTSIVLNGGAGDVLLEAVDGENIHLVVAAVPGSARDGEVFPWSYALTWEDEATAGDDTGGGDTDDDIIPDPARPTNEDPVEIGTPGCGCSTGTGGGWALGALFGALAVARRRR